MGRGELRALGAGCGWAHPPRKPAQRVLPNYRDGCQGPSKATLAHSQGDRNAQQKDVGTPRSRSAGRHSQTRRPPGRLSLGADAMTGRDSSGRRRAVLPRGNADGPEGAQLGTAGQADQRCVHRFAAPSEQPHLRNRGDAAEGCVHAPGRRVRSRGLRLRAAMTVDVTASQTSSSLALDPVFPRNRNGHYVSANDSV